MRTLDRRLRYFDIFYNDQSVEVDDVKAAVENELKGPGKLLGHRAMHRKIRQEYGINVTRDQVYNVMSDLDPEGLELGTWRHWGKEKRREGNFYYKGIQLGSLVRVVRRSRQTHVPVCYLRLPLVTRLDIEL